MIDISKTNSRSRNRLLDSSPRVFKMPAKEVLQVELFAVAISVVEGCKTPSIADNLALSESKVHRLRSLAKNLNLYAFDVDPTQAPNPIVLEKAHQLANRSEVFTKLKQFDGCHHLQFYKSVVTGTPALHDAASAEERMERLAVFAVEARPHLMQALTNAAITLVTYGMTLQQSFTVARFKSLGDKLKVYPACCDPFEYVHKSWSSSRLAQWITQQQGRSVEQHPSLAGLLPIIGPDQALEARQALRKYMENAPGYKAIFGPAGLASQANCLVTSIARTEQPWLMGDDYFVKTIAIDRQELLTLTDAEIGSVPIRKKILSPEQQARFDKISAARLGLRLEHVEAIAQMGASSPAPGVVVLAMGANKAKCFLELVKRGLVNIAIVDNSLEAKLRELIAKESPPLS